MRISDWSSDVCSSDLTALAFQKAADRGVAVGPVADQHLDTVSGKGGAHRLAVDRDLLIDLAGQAPVGGEIDEHGLALLAKLGKPGLAECRARKPGRSGGRGGGKTCAKRARGGGGGKQEEGGAPAPKAADRKRTRLNSDPTW